MYVVYLLQCKDGTLYAGITTDLKRRLKEHSEKKGGRYTRAHGAEKIIYSEKHRTRSAALKREHEIKGLRREKKLALSKT